MFCVFQSVLLFLGFTIVVRNRLWAFLIDTTISWVIAILTRIASARNPRFSRVAGLQTVLASLCVQSVHRGT